MTGFEITALFLLACIAVFSAITAVQSEKGRKSREP